SGRRRTGRGRCRRRRRSPPWRARRRGTSPSTRRRRRPPQPPSAPGHRLSIRPARRRPRPPPQPPPPRSRSPCSSSSALPLWFVVRVIPVFASSYGRPGESVTDYFEKTGVGFGARSRPSHATSGRSRRFNLPSASGLLLLQRRQELDERGVITD